MKYRTLLVALGLAGTLAADRIYRTVDEDGNVVFTDVPPRDSHVVDMPPANTYPAASRSYVGTPPAGTEPVTGDYYSALAILSPEQDAAVRANSGDIEIHAAIQPELRDGHRMLLVFDGEPTGIEADQASFYLTNVDRGTHTAAVAVVDRAGNVLKTSDPITFHVLRVSVLSPPPPRVKAH